MSRIPVGLLVEHLACSRGDVYAHAVAAADAEELRATLTAIGADHLSIPLSAADGDVAIIMCNRLFTVPRPVAALAATTEATGRVAGRLDAHDAGAKLLAWAHSAAAGPVSLSERWARIARGECEGNTKGTYRGV